MAALKLLPVLLRNSPRLAFRPPLVRSFRWGSPWDHLEELPVVFRRMERNMQDVEREMAEFFNSAPLTSRMPWPGWRRHQLPITFDITEVDGERKLKWQLEMCDFNPEDIQVTVKDKTLIIKAKKEESDGKGKSIQEYYREITLPDDVNLDSVKSLMSNGILKVEADLPKLSPPKETEIPVKKL